MPSAPATKAEIQRVINAWRDLGLPVGGVEVDKNGTVRVLAPLDKAAKNADRSREAIPWNP